MKKNITCKSNGRTVGLKGDKMEMDPFIGFRSSKIGSWEEAWWRARLDRHYVVMGGWGTRAPARRRTREKALIYMYNRGWYRNCKYGWTTRRN